MRSAEYPLEALSSLSFSRYQRLKACLLSGAAMGRTSPLSAMGPPRHRAQVLGDIFHEVMASINSVPGPSLSQSAFRDRFNTVLEEMHAKIAAAPSSRHLGNPSAWPELVDVYRHLAGVVETRRSEKWGVGTSTFAERKLTSGDGLLWGQVDAYFISSDGIDLVDYKSGAVVEDGEPKRQYEDQLLFYAYLIQQNHGTYPRSLRLVARDGGVSSLAPSSERSVALANEMRAVLARYNEVVAKESALEGLASPSSETCLFCDRKAICERFWGALPSLDIPSWNHVAIGTQIAPLARGLRGGGWLELEVERSSLSAQVIKVTRVFEQRFPGIDLEHRCGQRLLMTGLRQSKGTASAVVEATERSVIICLGAAS